MVAVIAFVDCSPGGRHLRCQSTLHALFLGVILLGSSGHAAPVKPAGLFASGPYLDISPITQGWQPSTVTAVVQAHDGYLWLGTYNGLMRYDGVRFTLFDSGNTAGLKNSRVTSLYEDAKS